MSPEPSTNTSDNSPDPVLEMRFDPKTINHLGLHLYSSLPPILAELIANCYDADANTVTIHLTDEAGRKNITVSDDGHGMAFDELNDAFLMIGRNRRESGEYSPGGRPVIGKKGLGKLAFFGITDTAEIRTVKDGVLNRFKMSYHEMQAVGADGNYRPDILDFNVQVDEANGTKIVMYDIRRQTPFYPEGHARSLAMYFMVFDEMQVSIQLNDDDPVFIDNDMKLEGYEIGLDWSLPDGIPEESDLFSHSIHGAVIGRVLYTVKPTDNGQRGIALFSRGKLVNNYSFYDVNINSGGFSYIVGHLNVDYIESLGSEVIATNRQTLNWENSEITPLQDYLQKLIRQLFNAGVQMRQAAAQAALSEATGVDLESWIGAMSQPRQLLARRLLQPIMDPRVPIETAKELITYVHSAFEVEEFREMAGHFAAEDGDQSVPQFLELMKRWKLIESREAYRLAKVRVEAIDTFDRHIRNDVREVPTMHDFLKQMPWILDPRIIEFRSEATYSSILKDKYPDDKLDEKDRRIDFLCTSTGGHLFIIELKRPGKTISAKDIEQADQYRVFLERLGDTDPNQRKTVVAYVIGGKLTSDDYGLSRIDNFVKTGKVFFQSYANMLNTARQYNREIIELFENQNQTPPTE